MKSALTVLLFVSMFGLANTAVYAQETVTNRANYKASDLLPSAQEKVSTPVAEVAQKAPEKLAVSSVLSPSANQTKAPTSQINSPFSVEI